MQLEGTYADLNRKGYLVVRDFLPQPLLAALVADAQGESIPPPIDPTHNAHAAAATASLPVSPAVFARLEGAIEALFPALNAQTGMHIDTTYPLARWFRAGVKRLHLDAPPFFQWQDFNEYLNFWIPVVKPRVDRSGLAFVPCDALQAHEPEAAKLIRGHGCCTQIPDEVVRAGVDAVRRYFLDPEYKASFPEDSKLGFVLEHEGVLTPIPMDTDPETLVVSPDLAAGDLLITRGDVLHRSQDREPGRLSISVRCFNGQHELTAAWLRNLSLPAKLFCMSPNTPMEAFITCFAHYGAESMPRRDVMRFAVAALAGDTPEAAAVAALKDQLPQLIDLPPRPAEA